MKMFEPNPFYMNRLNPAVFRAAAVVAHNLECRVGESIEIALSNQTFPAFPIYYKEPEIYLDFYVDQIYGGRVYISRFATREDLIPEDPSFNAFCRSLNLLFCAEILETFEPHTKDIDWDLRFLREEKPEKGNA